MASDDTTMQGLWLEGGTARVRADLEVPMPASGEARIRVRCAGICGTDLQLLQGYASFAGVPGHEFVGTVDAGPTEWIGRRVVADINFGCGSCSACGRNDPHHCARRRVLGIRDAPGALARWIIAPTANLVAVPASLPDDLAVFAEPVAAAARVVEQLDPAAGRRAAVVGAGRLGQLVARVLTLHDFDVTLAGRSTRSLEIAAAASIRSAPASSLRDREYDIAVDCSGSPTGLEAALRLVRPQGTVVLKSTHAGATPVDLAAIVVNEVRLIGSRCGSIAAGVALLESEALDPRDLIDSRFPLGDAVAALAAAAAPAAQKILVFP